MFFEKNHRNSFRPSARESIREYINQELITKFEQEYNAIVIEETVTSSETMFQKITAGTTSYDVAIPGDYMVTKLYKEGLLKEIDVNNQELKNLNNYKTMFNDDLTKLREASMKETMEQRVSA